jgi:hypothetical protein
LGGVALNREDAFITPLSPLARPPVYIVRAMTPKTVEVRWSRLPALFLGLLVVLSYSVPGVATASDTSGCGAANMAEQMAHHGPLPDVSQQGEDGCCCQCPVEACAPCDYMSVATAPEQVTGLALPAYTESVVTSTSRVPWLSVEPPAPPPESHR